MPRPFARRAVRGLWTGQPTTMVERGLLFLSVALLPLEDHLPSVAGVSVMFLLFGLLLAYGLLFRWASLLSVAVHPIFLAGYGFLLLGTTIESLHSNSSYVVHARVALMLIGAVVLAALCRDRRALKLSLYGYVAGAAWLSLLMVATTYSGLQSATASDYAEASSVRNQVVGSVPFSVDLNTIAFFIAQGIAVAFALVLQSRGFSRYTLLALSGICAVGVFLPMSRSGILIALACCLLVLLRSASDQVAKWLTFAVLCAGMLLAVPGVVFSRMTLATDGRAHIFGAVIDNFPEYAVTGVGAGNFWGPWGMQTAFSEGRDKVMGAHNSVFQITIYWGLLGLLALILLILVAWRSLPPRAIPDTLAVCVRPIGLSLLLWLLCTHTMFDKQFSIGLGLIAASNRWIWPAFRGRMESLSVPAGIAPRPVNLERVRPYPLPQMRRV